VPTRPVLDIQALGNEPDPKTPASGQQLAIVESPLGRITRMADLPLEHYKRSVGEFTRQAVDDFRQSAATEQEQRAALCRYFRRGAEADLSHTELIDFLGVSTSSVLDTAGYSEAAAGRVMLMLREITDDEIHSASL
jgi:hypothetical protein